VSRSNALLAQRYALTHLPISIVGATGKACWHSPYTGNADLVTGHEKTCQICADEAQLNWILENMLLAV
jgi:hypothetical protein